MSRVMALGGRWWLLHHRSTMARARRINSVAVRGILPARQGRLLGEVVTGLGQTSAGQLERRILAQLVEVVGIGITTGDGEDAGTQNVGDGVGDLGRIAVVGNERGE